MSNWTGFWTLTEREVSRIFRIWKQTIVPPMVTAILYMLVFGYSLGSRISEIQGVSYIQFIIPGLLMMGVIMNAYQNTSTSLFIGKFQKNIEEILAAPLSYWQIIAAFTLGGVIRGFCVAVGVSTVAYLLADIKVYSFLVLGYFVFMASLLFSFAGIITALWATDFDKLSIFGTFLIQPLIYLGGVFFSITMLPPFWQTVSKFNPILYIVDGFRYGFIGVSDIPLMHSAILLFAMAFTFFCICVHLFKIGYRLRT